MTSTYLQLAELQNIRATLTARKQRLRNEKATLSMDIQKISEKIKVLDSRISHLDMERIKRIK